MAGGRRHSDVFHACAVILTLVVVGGGGGGGGARAQVVEKGCPEIEYAYPFQSTCNLTALFGTPYHLVAPFSNAQVAVGGLRPYPLTVGDAADQANIVVEKLKFTGDRDDEGAKYVLTAVTTAPSTAEIRVGARFTITNVETKWAVARIGRLSEEMEFTAVGEIAILALAIEFELEVACAVPLPCPETFGARCLSYYLKSTDDGTYLSYADGHIVLAPKGTPNVSTLPLLLRRVKNSNRDLNILMA